MDEKLHSREKKGQNYRRGVVEMCRTEICLLRMAKAAVQSCLQDRGLLRATQI